MLEEMKEKKQKKKVGEKKSEKRAIGKKIKNLGHWKKYLKYIEQEQRESKAEENEGKQ